MTKILHGADLLCGAGGTTTGLIQAAEKLGYTVDLHGVNHDPLAIETIRANHPEGTYYCEALERVNPNEVVPEGRLDILVASPECIFFSRARGGRPKNDQSRSIAWSVLNWCERLYIPRVLIENVPEFRDWGPLDANGYPIKRKKGKTFLAFVDALRSLDYEVDWRILNCANYGDPTTRQRLFIMARREGAITWPEPTHAKDTTRLFGAVKPWRTAREIIDWSLPGESIFNRKRPLAENTVRRIVAGLRKYSGIEFVIGQQSGAVARSVDEPVPTVAGKGAISLVQPFIVKLYNTNDAAPIDEPLPTVTSGGNHLGLAEPFIIQMDNGGSLQSIDDPLRTVTSADARGLVNPFLVVYHGTGPDGRERVRSVEDPMPTVPASPIYGLAEPFIVATNHGKAERVHSVDEPMRTVTAFDAWGLAEPFLINYNGTGTAHSVDEPLDTVATHDRFGLVVVLKDGRQALLDIRFRMLQPHELAAAQGFPANYYFAGRKREDKVKMIGNAVPIHTAEALCTALLS